MIQLQPLAIHHPASLRIILRRIHQFHSSIRLYLFDSEEAGPFELEFSRKQVKFGIEEQNLLSWLKTLLQQFLVMVGLHLLFIQLGRLIGIKPHLFQL